MPRKRRIAKERVREITPELWAWLKTGLEPKPDTDLYWQVRYGDLHITRDHRDADRLREFWDEVADDVLAEVIAEAPGTRPLLWWYFDAPRLEVGVFPNWCLDGQLPEPRTFISGAGKPAWEETAYMPSFTDGLPDWWVGYRAHKPPVFENMPAYLRRHGLLTDSEVKRLPAAAFDPVPIEYSTAQNIGGDSTTVSRLIGERIGDHHNVN